MTTIRSFGGNMNWHCLGQPRRRGGRLGLWVGLIVLFMLAAAPRTTLALPGRSLVVLNISEGGRTQESLRAHVSEFLKRTGVKLVDLPRLPNAERGCEESSCLNRLAEEHRAQLLLGARIERHGPHDRIIYMWLYDSRSGRDQSEQKVCDVRDLQERLQEVAGKLIGPYLQDGEPAPPRPEEMASGAAEPPPTAHSTRPAWRSRLALSLGILSLGALATAIALQSVTGQETGMSCQGQMMTCVHDYTKLFAPMYATAGALAVGTILTLTLPAKKEVH